MNKYKLWEYDIIFTYLITTKISNYSISPNNGRRYILEGSTCCIGTLVLRFFGHIIFKSVRHGTLSVALRWEPHVPSYISCRTAKVHWFLRGIKKFILAVGTNTPYFLTDSSLIKSPNLVRCWQCCMKMLVPYGKCWSWNTPYGATIYNMPY